MTEELKYERLEAQIRGHLRFAVRAFAIAVPIMYAIIFWSWCNRRFAKPEVNWLGLFTLPLLAAVFILGLMWVASRGDLKKARESDQQT